MAEKIEIFIEGYCTIERAKEFYDKFLDALKRTDEVIVKFGNIKKVDISFLQVICSAHRTFVIENKKKFYTNDKLPLEIKNFIKDSGYNIALEHCHPDKCFFKEVIDG